MNRNAILKMLMNQGKWVEESGAPPLTLDKSMGKPLRDYKIYGNSFRGRLPSAYQEVEYIESDGNQHIDTGLEGKNGYTMDTKVVFTDFPNNYGYVAGFGTSSSNRIYFTRAQKSGLTDGWTFDGNSHNIASVSVATNTEYVYKSIMEINNQKLYRNGVLLDSYTQSAINSYGTVWLFAANYNDGRNGAVACKMYYCQFTYDGNLVRDFVPCYRKSDGEIGMYDKVEGKFYANQGSGSFVKGQDVNPIPTIENEVPVYGVGDKTKNMINVPKVYTFTSYPKLNSLIDMDKIELGVQYKVVWSKTIKGGTYNPAMNLGGNVGWLNSMSEDGGSFTFTYTTLPENIYIYSNGGNASRSAGITSTVEGLMIIRADETNDYEEYGYKIPINDNGKETIAYVDDPLYKIADKLDYADYKNQKTYRNVREQIITGQENWEGGTDFFRFRISTSNIVDGNISVTEQKCNYAECKIVTVSGSETGASVYYSSGLGGTYFRIRPDITIGSIANFKTLMQQYYDSGHPLKIYYPSNTTEDTTLLLPDVMLDKGINVLDVKTNVKPSNMKVTYKKKN